MSKRGRPGFVCPENVAALLGKAPDAQLARIAKCSTTTIAGIRKNKGIPAYVTPSNLPVATKPQTAEQQEEKKKMLLDVDEMVKKGYPASLRKAMKAAVATDDGWMIPFKEYSELLADLLEMP